MYCMYNSNICNLLLYWASGITCKAKFICKPSNSPHPAVRNLQIQTCFASCGHLKNHVRMYLVVHAAHMMDSEVKSFTIDSNYMRS